MFKNTVRALSLVMALVLLLTVGGVYATWTYGTPPAPEETTIPVKLSNFHYADIYIIKITPKDSGLTKTDHTKVSATVSAGSSYEVTFYNGSNVSYYYKEAETLSGNAKYTVSGIVEKEEVPAESYKTVTVTFSTGGSAEIFFHFVIDKDSIGEVVARTAVDRFRDILNNIAFEDSYETLDTAMDNRSGWNKASAVTYIGNVSGSNSGDSATINTLFGSEFMSMDLDGDGDTEPITMMIKREDLDDNLTTGAPYTYTSGRNEYTVNGAEMTLYITAEKLTSQRTVTVYAVVFTKHPGETEWVEMVPLTKGTATTNNYTGLGSANSFNTDTWKSNDGKTLRQIIDAQN